MADQQPVFSESSHAILFALIARQVFTRYGEEKGLPALRKAIRRYGEQRGRRMALRAQANGDQLTMTNFLVYGEWRSVTGSGQMERVEEQAGIRMTVQRCPWEAAWKAAGLLPYGRYYCQEIDAALLRGFNPELLIEVNQTLPNEGLPCEFFYRQAVLEPGNTLADIAERSARLESQRVMPWEYHCGHLYQTCSLVMGEEFGPPGRVTVQNALAEFALRYGGAAAAIVAGYLKTDFDKLPDPPEKNLSPPAAISLICHCERFLRSNLILRGPHRALNFFGNSPFFVLTGQAVFGNRKVCVQLWWIDHTVRVDALHARDPCVGDRQHFGLDGSAWG